MSDSLPEDVAALCNHAGIDSSRYKDFASHRVTESPTPRPAAGPASGPSGTSLAEQQRPAPARDSTTVAEPAPPGQPGIGPPPAREPAPPPAIVRTERAVNPVSEVTSNLIELPRPAHRPPPPEPAPPAAAESPRAQRNRWSAIQDALSPDPPSKHAGVSASTLPLGSISIFGVGGGVGKTTIAANLARVLTGAGESVLLAGLSPDSILPLYFGARSVPGSGLRSFLLPGNPGRGSLHLYLDSPARNDDQEGKDVLNRLCAQADVAQGDLNRAILVFPAGAPAPLLSVLRNTSVSLAIVVPDLICAIGVGKLLRFFRGCQDELIAPYFLINKFDSARPLHQEMRNRLHEQLGARLLPLVIRRSDDVEDAPLAGMTVIDYAPATNVAQDFEHLADWVVSHTSRARGGR